jgi:hypothetical protein
MTDKIDDGGSAFARPMSHDGDGPRADAFPAQDGMSLRDYFAGQALAGLLVNDTDTKIVDTATDAYRIADAMIKARGQV